jgi:hypothetical protein
MTLSVLKRQSLKCLRDDKTRHLLMILELGMGMLIMCKKNNYGPKEIANNTFGDVLGY